LELKARKYSKINLCVNFLSNPTNGHLILQASFRVPLGRLSNLRNKNFLMKVICLLAADGLDPLAALKLIAVT